MDFTLEAVAPVPVLNRNGQFQTIEFVVDTGFDGFLALPATLIRRLGLERYGSTRVTFANGQQELCNTWNCRILWHDQPRDIVISSPGVSYCWEWRCWRAAKLPSKPALTGRW